MSVAIEFQDVGDEQRELVGGKGFALLCNGQRRPACSCRHLHHHGGLSPLFNGHGSHGQDSPGAQP
ncbi:MAG: hypothetical protein MZV64_31230 [Ignavibacteriales bacterium]|nr:hypothetical protein [Ignavibacteriales bacterium]